MTPKDSDRIIEERLAHSRELSAQMEQTGKDVVRALRNAASAARTAKQRDDAASRSAA